MQVAPKIDQSAGYLLNGRPTVIGSRSAAFRGIGNCVETIDNFPVAQEGQLLGICLGELRFSVL